MIISQSLLNFTKSFLYKVKGKAIRESVGEVDTSNEKQLLVALDNEIEWEMGQRGRKLLEEASVLIFLGWDIN